MKQITILSGKVMIVELPDGRGEYNMFLWDAYYDVTGDFHEVPSLASNHKDPDKTRILLPEGNWRIIGMLSEVTERQCRGLVDEAESGYRGYLPNSGFVYKSMAFGMSSFGYAWGSLLSAIFALGYVFNDPDEGDYDLSAFDAQDRVLDRNRCLLLGREI